MCDENLIMYIFRWKKIITKSHGTKKISMTHETIPSFPNNSEFVSMYLEKRWHTDLELSPSWYEWKMKEKQLIKASRSDFVICTIHVNVTSKQQQHMCAERAMGFGRQQRLNAADTDKYSHFEEAKCTFINPTIYNIICWFAGPMGTTTCWSGVWRSEYFFFS